jgi:hypothetical protein
MASAKTSQSHPLLINQVPTPDARGTIGMTFYRGHCTLIRSKVADVPDAALTAFHWQAYDSPMRAAILALGLG